MKKVLLFFIFLLSFLSSPPKTYAWYIEKFHSDITLQNDGLVKVDETIHVNFESEEKHGIYRDIPYVYENKQKEKTYTEITVADVLQDNSPAQNKTTTNDNYVRIRVGDPDTTITGKHIYRIVYLAKGVLRGFETYDELYWNVTGNQWGVPIQSATATIRTQQDILTRTACYQSNTQTNCNHQIVNGTQAHFATTDPLVSNEGMTIVVGYKKGIIPLLTGNKPHRWEDDISKPSTILAGVFTAFAGCLFVFSQWIKKGRDYWFRTRQILDPNAQQETMPIGAHETIVVEFEPPEKLRPAEIGVLMDEKADTKDVTATIIDLAARGYVQITEEAKSWAFGSTDYTFTKIQKDQSTLLPYEKLLLDKIFLGKQTETLSALKKTFYDDLAMVKKKLYENVMQKKIFAENPESVRGKYIALSILIITAGIMGTFGGADMQIAWTIAVSIGIILIGLFSLLVSFFMPRRSAIGHELYQRAKGYQQFINGAEKYRQQFAEKKNIFNEVLPYTIVFGLTDKFAKAMKDMGIEAQNTGWYVGNQPVHTSMFVSNVNAFSQSFGTAIAQTPSSSGFSGGSSGGGFGGGGGGSW